MKSYVLGPNDELVRMYEKLMCSFGYQLKRFEPLTATYRLRDYIIPKDSRYRMFYVHYKTKLVHCGIVITPVDEVYITYVDAHTSDKKIIKIMSYTTIKQIIKILKEKGRLD